VGKKRGIKGDRSKFLLSCLLRFDVIGKEAVPAHTAHAKDHAILVVEIQYLSSDGALSNDLINGLKELLGSDFNSSTAGEDGRIDSAVGTFFPNKRNEQPLHLRSSVVQVYPIISQVH